MTTEERLRKKLLITQIGAAGMLISSCMSLWGAVKLRDGYDDLKAQHITLYERVQYLLNRLEQESINIDDFMDEFDLIALKNMEHPDLKRRSSET